MTEAKKVEFALRSEERIVFHATTHAFPEFSEHAIGGGKDNNSALGFHFADDPTEALDYGGLNKRILVVGAVTENPTLEFNDYYRFFGYDENGNSIVSKAQFADHRQRLLAEGYDAIEYQDSEQTICVVLDPSKLRILAQITEEEALALDAAIAALPDPTDDAERLRLVNALIRRREVEADDATAPSSPNP